MRWGLDVTDGAIYVATTNGTTRYLNRVDRGRDVDDGEDVVIFEVDGESYVLSRSSSGDAGDAVGVLGATESTAPDSVAGGALEAILVENSDDGVLPDEEAHLVGSIVRSSELTGLLAELSADLGLDQLEVDPGMAVSYAASPEPPTGLGVAIGEETAVATLAIGGVPVASARIRYADRWYDVSEASEQVGTAASAEWQRVQSDALMDELLFGVATRSPEIVPALPIVIGGERATEALHEYDPGALTDACPFDIESIQVLDESGAAPSRGALAAIEGADELEAPVPVYAAMETYVTGHVDVEAAVEALAGGIEAVASRDAASAAEEPAHGLDSSGALSVELYRRHHDRLSRVVDQLLANLASNEHVARVEAELDALAEAHGELEAGVAEAATAADLESSIAGAEEEIAELNEELHDVRSVVTGLADFEPTEAEAMADALESLGIDALDHEIDEVEDSLSSRIDRVWQEFDDVNNRLVDFSARLDELSDLGGTIETQRSTIDEIESTVEDIERSVADLQGAVEDVGEVTTTRDKVRSVSDELAGVRDDLAAVESRIEAADWAEPAEVEGVERALDALRDTVANHARRLEGIERTTSDLDDRIDQAFQGTAKADALASLQTEVSRIRQEVTATRERATEARNTAAGLDDRLDSIRGDVDQVEMMVEGVAERSATRSEMQDEDQTIRARLGEIENTQEELAAELGDLPGEGQLDERALQLLIGALAAAGVLGSLFALSEGQAMVALAFLVVVVGPAGWVWLSVSGRHSVGSSGE